MKILACAILLSELDRVFSISAKHELVRVASSTQCPINWFINEFFFALYFM